MTASTHQDRHAHAPQGHEHHHAHAHPPRVGTPQDASLKGPAAPAGTIYTCPMHPEIRQDHPGKCPKCGMSLEPELPATLIVDKTGTLTEGRPAFERAVAAGGFDDLEVLRLAASLDQGSEHPLAAAIVAAARDQGLNSASPRRSIPSRASVSMAPSTARHRCSATLR